MSYDLFFNDLVVSVTPKDIKNLHLAVYPPHGEVRVSAPLWMNEDRIKYYIISKMGWIRKQRAELRDQAREPEREFLNMETHFVWGQPCLLRIHPDSSSNKVNLDHDTLNIYMRGEPVKSGMHDLLQSWYRGLVANEAKKRIEYWRGVFSLPPIEFCVRRMKTRWGSCIRARNKILLNTSLAKKPRECLDYVVAHELAHFFIPNHGENFIRFMDKYLPNWKMTKKLLNSLPLEE